MSDMPLTRPAPWTEIPPAGDMEPLFGEHLFARRARSGERTVQVTVTRPAGDSREVIMDLIVREADLGRMFRLAVEQCEGLPSFRIDIGRVEGWPSLRNSAEVI
jgi:hypothetical protein